MLRRSQHGKQPPSVYPRTFIGQYLDAMIGGHLERRRQLSEKLGGGKPGWNWDEPAVVQAACELAVRRLWGTNYDVRDVTAAVTFMREASKERRGQAPYGQLEMEAVIRVALGEIDVDMSGIIPPTAFEIQIAVIAYAAAKLELSDSEVDQVIVEAENIAFDRGFNPPLAGVN
jgi:hypothetical protein